MTINGKTFIQGTLGISLFDTRGQITMSKKEGAEIDYLMQVRSLGENQDRCYDRNKKQEICPYAMGVLEK